MPGFYPVVIYSFKPAYAVGVNAELVRGNKNISGIFLRLLPERPCPMKTSAANFSSMPNFTQTKSAISFPNPYNGNPKSTQQIPKNTE